MKSNWPLKTAEKDLIDSFNAAICINFDRIKDKKIYIWGASVRGTLLGILLNNKGIRNFKFIDNDERKKGNKIGGYSIYSSEIIKEKSNDIFIFIPIEYGKSVIDQLVSLSIDEKNYFWIQTDIYIKFCDEFYRENTNKLLIMGETFLNETIIEEAEPKSIKDELWKYFNKDSARILAMNCTGMQTFYYLLQIQLSLNKIPDQFIFFINYEILTEFHHLLPRAQHPDLLKMIKKRYKNESNEFDEYIHLANQRSLDYKMELQYSPQRTSAKDHDLEMVRKNYLLQGLMYNLNTDSVEFYFLNKILELASINRISTYLILPPINYELASDYYGNQFREIYDQNSKILMKAAVEKGAELIDLGYLLKKNEFEASVTVNDGIYSNGRNIIIQKIIEILRN